MSEGPQHWLPARKPCLFLGGGKDFDMQRDICSWHLEVAQAYPDPWDEKNGEGGQLPPSPRLPRPCPQVCLPHHRSQIHSPFDPEDAPDKNKSVRQ